MAKLIWATQPANVTNGFVFGTSPVLETADASGNPSGPPLAVAKLTWKGDNLPFELSEADAMVGGTELAGDVVLLVRYDQDGDALSKQPGDVTGQLKLKIPTDHADVVLDTVL